MGCLTLALALLVGVTVRASSILSDFPPDQRVYSQRTDHFSFSASARTTFPQRFLVYDKFWRRPTTAQSDDAGPILFYLGNEGQIETFYNDTGILFTSLGPELGGLIVFVEHRYYGDSVPEGASEYQFLSIEQALQDYAEFLVWFKASPEVHCPQCKVFCFGGSYGGMLVGWFREKYPHLTDGGVLSSAPLDFYDFQAAGVEVGQAHQAIDPVQQRFWSAVLDTFRAMGGQQCVVDIERALSLLRSPTPAGGRVSEDELHAVFRTCEAEPGQDPLYFYIKGALSSLAMVNYPFPFQLTTELPAYPARKACELLVGGKHDDQELGILGRMNAVLDLYVGNAAYCRNVSRELFGNNNGDAALAGSIGARLGAATAGRSVRQSREKPSGRLEMDPWNFQACTELPMQPLTTDFLGFYPPENQADYESLRKNCNARYRSSFGANGIDPDPSWVPTTYGGHSMTEALSNVVIVDGAFDPWNAGALSPRHGQELVLGGGMGSSTPGLRLSVDSSRQVLKIYPIPGAAHHQDLISAHATDTEELREARRLILTALARWSRGGRLDLFSESHFASRLGEAVPSDGAGAADADSRATIILA